MLAAESSGTIEVLQFPSAFLIISPFARPDAKNVPVKPWSESHDQ